MAAPLPPIGGFFELELPLGPARPHPRAAGALASGRACLGWFARTARPARVWVPFFICDSVLHALTAAGVAWAYYALDENLELASPRPLLADNEYLLYVNYFGLKNDYLPTLRQQYGLRLLLDLTQAFFCEPGPGEWGFNSARKFFGVPDGGYLYAPTSQPGLAELPENQDLALDHLLLRQQGKQAAAYAAFAAYEESLPDAPTRMSAVSRSWLSWLNYEAIATQRQANYQHYASLLAPLMQASGPARPWLPLSLAGTGKDAAVPFCFPLRLRVPLLTRTRLFEQRIFVPWLWPEVQTRAGDFPLEKSLVGGVLALPLDHRYGPAEVARVAQAVRELLG